jgi:vesicle-associated membrane protein 7
MVVEYPASGSEPKLSQTMATVMATVPIKEHCRQTVEDQDVNYHYLSSGDGRVVGCAASKDVRTRTVAAFLEAMEAQTRAAAASPQLLQQQVAYFNDPTNVDKVAAVQGSLDRAKDLMAANVERTLDRGDAMQALENRGVALNEQAAAFDAKSAELQKGMCARRGRLIFAGAIVLFVVAAVLATLICKPDFSGCRS